MHDTDTRELTSSASSPSFRNGAVYLETAVVPAFSKKLSHGRNGELSWPGLLRRQCVASVLALLGPLCAGSKMVTLDSGLCKMVARHSGAVAGTR